MQRKKGARGFSTWGGIERGSIGTKEPARGCGSALYIKKSENRINMNPFDLTGLSRLMAFTAGRAEVRIGLIDGPVAVHHRALTPETLCPVTEEASSDRYRENAAARHGTFIAGMLNANRRSETPGICPGCTLLIRPVFTETKSDDFIPATTPAEVATAITECIDHGAQVLNVSIALEGTSREGDRVLNDALDYAARKEVIVVAAAGNQRAFSGSVLTRHPGVIPVVATDRNGNLTHYSNLTGAIRRNGLKAPGEKIGGVADNGRTVRFCGTSVAVPFVSGAAALLMSLFPERTVPEIRSALKAVPARKRQCIEPPLLNAAESFDYLMKATMKVA
jgi:hypothetical protein